MCIRMISLFSSRVACGEQRPRIAHQKPGLFVYCQQTETQSRSIRPTWYNETIILPYVEMITATLQHLTFTCDLSGGYPEYGKTAGFPRLLHYSASVHLVDMLPPPPAISRDNAVDAHSLTSDEG